MPDMPATFAELANALLGFCTDRDGASTTTDSYFANVNIREHCAQNVGRILEALKIAAIVETPSDEQAESLAYKLCGDFYVKFGRQTCAALLALARGEA